eukprot:3328758-Amphidinium_carterae.1
MLALCRHMGLDTWGGLMLANQGSTSDLAPQIRGGPRSSQEPQALEDNTPTVTSIKRVPNATHSARERTVAIRCAILLPV